MKLTKSFIANLTPSKKSQEIYWDDLIPNLGVRVNPGGKKSWVVRYRIKRRRRLKVIGSTLLLTLDEARGKAKVLLLKVLDKKDPLPTAKSMTKFEDFAEVYMTEYSKPKKSSWTHDETNLRKYIIPEFGRKPVGAITEFDITQLHNKITHKYEHPYAANRVLEQLHTMFKYAIKWKYREKEDGNPAEGIESNPEYPRDRWLNQKEFEQLAIAINSYSDPHVRVAIWIYVLTALRKMELLKVKWIDVNWETKKLRISDHKTKKKTKKSKYVPMCKTMMALFKCLPQKGIYVFPGVKPNTHRTDIKGPWKTIRKRAGLDSDDKSQQVRLHDLRHTVGAWLTTNNYSMKVVGSVLGHSSEQATNVYAHLADEAQKNALEFVEDMVKDLIQFPPEEDDSSSDESFT